MNSPLRESKSRPLEYESATKPPPTPPTPERVPEYQKILGIIAGSGGGCHGNHGLFPEKCFRARASLITGAVALILYGLAIRFRTSRF